MSCAPPPPLAPSPSSALTGHCLGRQRSDNDDAAASAATDCAAAGALCASVSDSVSFSQCSCKCWRRRGGWLGGLRSGGCRDRTLLRISLQRALPVVLLSDSPSLLSSLCPLPVSFLVPPPAACFLLLLPLACYSLVVASFPASSAPTDSLLCLLLLTSLCPSLWPSLLPSTASLTALFFFYSLLHLLVHLPLSLPFLLPLLLLLLQLFFLLPLPLCLCNEMFCKAALNAHFLPHSKYVASLPHSLQLPPVLHCLASLP